MFHQPMPPDFSILEALKRHDVPFVIIGGHAVNFHGYGRATEDTDIVWVRSARSEQALANALGEVDAHYVGKEIDPATGVERTHPVNLRFIQANHLMMLWTKQGFLDLFDYIPGFPSADVNDLLANSVESHGLRFASLDWLRKMKEASGRPQDLLDLKNLPDAQQ